MHKNVLRQAIHTLQQGGVVVFPTETSYGFAADATNTEAIRRIFVLKGRPSQKTPPLIAASMAMAEKYAVLSSRLHALAREHWPGALTIVAPVRKGSGLSSGVVREDTVAIRVSSHPIARALSKAIDAPIVATSANLADEPACYSIASFHRQFARRHLQPDFILDVGGLVKRKPSTIVEERGGKIVVVRKGSLALDARHLV